MPIRLCGRCRGELGPKFPRQPRLDLLVLERGGTSKGMVDNSPPDARSEAAKRKKERKERGRVIRTMIQSGDIRGAQRFAFTTIALPSPSDECPDCLKLQSRIA